MARQISSLYDGMRMSMGELPIPDRVFISANDPGETHSFESHYATTGYKACLRCDKARDNPIHNHAD